MEIGPKILESREGSRIHLCTSTRVTGMYAVHADGGGMETAVPDPLCGPLSPLSHTRVTLRATIGGPSHIGMVS